ncbi:hypothetical protein [Kiritimatiella glycovorans]|uniref:Uncharacterized protein n=1 Tax=Kiritimatiella glycovorans TaxID=1307763 RepID=A0A0G3EJX5_9BACT|nr:hypothetical protein [Kiritimatiella glycovorans]AKJ65095.1 hypothetical protein L21SP4_01858 [Kiritimatiella glycovorans]
MSGLLIAGLTVGAIAALSGAWALARPEQMLGALKAFPRDAKAAAVLTAVDLAWAAIELNRMYLGTFDRFKPALWILTPLLIFLCIKYMDELLAARALGGLLLLVAAPILDAVRWFPTAADPSPWRLVMAVLAYLWIAYGLLLLCAPYWFRKHLEWWTSFDPRLRVGGALKLLAGLALIVLSLCCYRG